jgi:hypothetical protein
VGYANYKTFIICVLNATIGSAGLIVSKIWLAVHSTSQNSCKFCSVRILSDELLRQVKQTEATRIRVQEEMKKQQAEMNAKIGAQSTLSALSLSIFVVGASSNVYIC